MRHVAHTSELCRRCTTAGRRACLPLAPAENLARYHPGCQSKLSPTPPDGSWSTKNKLPTCCIVYSSQLALCAATPAPAGAPCKDPPQLHHGSVSQQTSAHAVMQQAVAPGRSLHLQVPIRVVYLDRSMAGFGGGASADSGEINHHDFVPETAAQTTSPAVPRVHLLYRPGHFDILLHPV